MITYLCLSFCLFNFSFFNSTVSNLKNNNKTFHYNTQKKHPVCLDYSHTVIQKLKLPAKGRGDTPGYTSVALHANVIFQRYSSYPYYETTDNKAAEITLSLCNFYYCF